MHFLNDNKSVHLVLSFLVIVPVIIFVNTETVVKVHIWFCKNRFVEIRYFAKLLYIRYLFGKLQFHLILRVKRLFGNN